jgi:hypothetical protein
MGTKLNLIGQKFGRLKVIAEYGCDPTKVEPYCNYVRWICVCDCGEQKIVSAGCLLKGQVRSCGCLRTEYNIKLGQLHTTHGCSSGSLTYRTWLSIKCLSRKKGIPMFDEWYEHFEAFLLDMGERPSGTKIRRLDMSLGYEPGNCIWRPNGTHKGVKIPVAGLERLTRDGGTY